MTSGAAALGISTPGAATGSAALPPPAAAPPPPAAPPAAKATGEAASDIEARSNARDAARRLCAGFMGSPSFGTRVAAQCRPDVHDLGRHGLAMCSSGFAGVAARPCRAILRALPIAHLGFEVSDLARSARFYDAVFHALGSRRMHEGAAAVAYGTDETTFWIVERGRPPAPGYGHVALRAAGRAAVDAAHAAGLAHGGRDDGPPGPRPQYGARTYAAYLLDPDGLRVEVVAV